MQALLLDSRLTAAAAAAAANFRSNTAALSKAQPTVADALRGVVADLHWVYGRDGYLTALDPAERWLDKCSVPLLAARSMLRMLEPASGVSCFLHPTHAAQVRVVLDRQGGHHALIGVLPSVETLATLLCCDDFSDEVTRGRLWIALGSDWPSALRAILIDNPGVPTPTRFVRMPHAPADVIDPMVKAAQTVFAAENARRAETIRVLRDRRVNPATQSLCVVAGSAFRLWDDAGHTLWTTLANNLNDNVRRIDSDDPAHCSTLALATLAAACRAIVAADVFRADASQLTRLDQPWITWVTAPRIASAASAGPNDRLLLADARWQSLARQAGWPDDRVSEAAWPVAPRVDDANPAGRVALIADTTPLDAPEPLAELSSHQLLWERLRERVLAGALPFGADVQAWLAAEARQVGIDVVQLDSALFINRLILPAFQQSIARRLLARGAGVQFHGRGWSEIEPFAAYASGPVESREQLNAIAAHASALVYAWPAGHAHPIESLGRPVVDATGTPLQLRAARGPVLDVRTVLASLT